MVPIRENRAKRKLQQGEVVSIIGGYNSALIVDFLGQFGFDGAWIETEHGPIDFADIPDLTRACDLWGMTSVVRVNQNNAGIIYRTLDCGAQGIAVPHVNTAEEAHAVVQAAKFHPLGQRGMFLSRQAFGRPDYLAQANDETLIVVFIEDIIAVQNLSEILTVDHIDVFFVAPADLAQSMGHLQFPVPPEVQQVQDEAIAQIVAAGKTAGTLANDDDVEHHLKNGARFLLATWGNWVANGAQSYLQKVASQ